MPTVTTLPIPHREPFLFVTEQEAVSDGEALFRYELPRMGDTFALRMFPELLTVEAMAQASAAFHGLNQEPGEVEQGVLASVDRVRFHGRPNPGDALTIKIRKKKEFGALVMLDGEVWVHHRMVAQGEFVVRREPGRAAS